MLFDTTARACSYAVRGTRIPAYRLLFWFPQLIAISLENGLDVFQPVQAFPVGDMATGIQALAGVYLVQVE